jgi:DNA-binding transcriptional regulator YiaG
MSKQYRNEAMAAIHETIEALHDVEAIDKQTMRRFEAACLTPILDEISMRCRPTQKPGGCKGPRGE